MNNYNVGANQFDALMGVGKLVAGGGPLGAGITSLTAGLKPLFSGFEIEHKNGR